MKVIFFIIVIIIIIGSFVFAMNNPRNDKGALDDNPPAGGGEIINNQDKLMNILKLTSSAFENNGKIPSRYTCDGEGINPKLKIQGVSKDAKSLVLIMDDPDAPSGVWDHWVKFNIATSTIQIKEGEEPAGVSGAGTSGNKDYFGPCPPDREHRYFFKLYSLDTMLELKDGVTKKEVEKAMEGHILQQAELIGLYERS